MNQSTPEFSGLSQADYFVVVLVFDRRFLRPVSSSPRITKPARTSFVGGNRIPWWAAGVSLYMSTFSAWMFTGAASFVYNTGWFGLLFFVANPIGFVIGFLFSAVKWRRARISSPVEYVEERYNHTTRLVIGVVLCISMLYWPGQHLAAVARISAPALFPDVPWAVDGLIIFFWFLRCCSTRWPEASGP